ncbi:MAG: DUF692 family protein [Spirochaetales bacterium]|nr:DUF692 family protein [Spirochaetales bacterium]
MNIGVTYNPYNKENERIISELSDEIDFIEIKNLELSLLRSKKDILDKFSMKSMHVQYLSKQENPTTLNLVSDEKKEIISDKNSDLYKAFDFLDPFVISFHTGFSSKEVGTKGIDNHNYAIGEILSEKEVFKSITNSLRIITRMLRERGYKGKILIENLDYHPTGAYEYICKPYFISKVAENTNCGVLVDLAHTIISAHSFGMDVIDFVEKIGIDRIYEIHVNSPLYKDGEWYDINEPFYFSEEAKRVLEHIIKREKAKVLNIECDKEIIEQLEACIEVRGTKDG